MITDRIPLAPPLIQSLPEPDSGPLWSVMIPTYNCSNFLIETLQSVLVQDRGMGKMQIEVIDDCSTDGNVEELVKQVGGGRVDFFSQSQNSGSLRNFETCIKRSRGKWIHILHGDDLVKPGFYDEIEKLFHKYPSVGAAFTGLSTIDEKGILMYHNNNIQDYPGIIKDWLLKIASDQRLRTCAIVVKRSVYEKVGSYFGVHYGEDWEMFVRIAANFTVAYSPAQLALYRVHNNNISSRYLVTGQNIKDIKAVINIIQPYLPADKRKELKTAARKNFSIYFSGNAMRIYRKQGNARVALKQAHGALSLHVNKKTLYSLLKLYIKVLINYKTPSGLPGKSAKIG